MAVQQLTSIDTRYRGDTMKIKLIIGLTTIAMFALPAADAFAGHYS